MEVIVVKTEIQQVPESLISETESGDAILDGSPRGGDDDMMEGTEIKTTNFADWSESDSEVV